MIINVNEFDFNGQTYIVSAEVMEKGLKKVWPLGNIMRPDRVQLKFSDVGDRRWLCYVKLPYDKEDDFKNWVQEYLGDRFMMSKTYEYVNGNVTLTYELRGGDPKDKLLLALVWA